MNTPKTLIETEIIVYQAKTKPEFLRLFCFLKSLDMPFIACLTDKTIKINKFNTVKEKTNENCNSECES